MKTTKEKADAIYSKFEDEIIGLEGEEWYDSALNCAILSVKHTIEVLEKAFNEQEGTKDIYPVAHYILEQTKLLTELESRL